MDWEVSELEMIIQELRSMVSVSLAIPREYSPEVLISTFSDKDERQKVPYGAAVFEYAMGRRLPL
jgi:hypothetical protein